MSKISKMFKDGVNAITGGSGPAPPPPPDEESEAIKAEKAFSLKDLS